MLDIIIVVVALVLTSYLAFSPRLTKSAYWKATVTPLASIMGSGFLVSAPLLAGIVGNLAVVCLAVLLLLAYLVGDAIRFNIWHFEPIENSRQGHAQNIAFASRIVLAAAYFVSVSYYLQLLAAFVLNYLGINNEVAAHSISTTLLMVIGFIGMCHGLGELGKVEKYTVSLNLGMIGSLLVALAVYNGMLLLKGEWALPDVNSEIDLHDIRVLLGLLIVVQGFETSRYLGDEFPAEERVRTMRTAQRTSAAIYIVFVSLATILFRSDLGGDVTAIMVMTRPVALVLPILLAIAAVGSQFSASVADTEGAGGSIEDITGHKISERHAYLLILVVTIALTWGTNVNRIIAYASRAFALYYTLQCVVAFLVAWHMQDLAHRKIRLTTFGALAVVCLLVFLFGLPAE